jgi:hypothetical protein
MTRLLLCGVYKPFGIKDETTEALCTMELLNNQVTREQGIHSPRSNNPSFGLYLMAENIQVPATVLDFPSWDQFKKEIDSGAYTHVGISFIIPNVLKAKRMAEYIRRCSPRTKILLGGHGAAIPELRDMVDCDEICHGEGVSWLRRYFGEEVNRPIIHPTVPSSINSYVYGAPILGKAGIIIPGVGCQNSCRFCATSHKFDRQYTPFLRTGQEMFAACRKAEEEMGVDDFGLMDENFWIGVESKANLFEKTKGIDLNNLIADLQNHGISVLASAILFLEHHDKETIHEDIDWAIGLESDFLQFMELGPSPGTQLYQDYETEGKMVAGIPWTKKHGQDEIWFNHPHFSLPETANYLREAFIKKYHTHGPSVLNMALTSIKGYLRVKAEVEEREKLGLMWDPESLKYVPSGNRSSDAFMRLRLDCMKSNALRFRPALSSTLKYAPNAMAAEKCREVMRLYSETFGPMTFSDRMKSLIVRLLSIRESRRIKNEGTVMRQPPTNRIAYPDRSIEAPAEDYLKNRASISNQPEMETVAQ